MKCPKCGSDLKKVRVNVYGAKTKVLSYQCRKCSYFSFDPETSEKAIQEIKETPLKIEQKVVKLSQDRLGIYFNKHIVNSLNLKKGETIKLSVPDKKHLIIELKRNI